jgi:DNA-3-methyladenine glycosylase II
MHRIDGNSWIKMIKLAGNPVIFRVSNAEKCLRITPLNTVLTNSQQAELIRYINEVFDLGRDLRPFYDHLKADPVLGGLCRDYYGLRLLGIPDLFEALSWSIIGQQINLTFAYRLKKRLVEAKGECLRLEGEKHYLFPTPLAVSQVSGREFSDWQFSGSKAAYLVGVAREILNGSISRDLLINLSPDEAYQRLLQLKGIGPWSAQYVMMKCLRTNTAFPVSDVGLQNAVKDQTGSDTKPSIQELTAFSHSWDPWQAYATFYLWHSLIK